MFREIAPRLNVIQMEEAVLRMWKHRHIFEKSGAQRQGMPEYVFYEGPPTANGLPGVHHVLARAIKDVFPRYQVMRGRHVIRRGGWDTHGLPVEIEVEQTPGLYQQESEAGTAAVRGFYTMAARKVAPSPGDPGFERRRLPLNEFMQALRQRYPEFEEYFGKAVERYVILRARNEAP